MESNYVDLYHNVDNDTMTEQEGLELHGRDGVFCTSPLYTDIPLLTESQSVAEAINELFGQGTGAANGSFRAVLDNNAGLLKIIVQEGEKYADHEFAYETFDFSDSITTKVTSGDTVTTTTRKFSKRIITTLTDSSGAVLLLTEYNADNGETLGYTDGSGEVVYTSEWRTEYKITETQSQGASSAAVAWVMARNVEQSESLAQQKKAYRKGIIDYGDNVEEVIDDKGQTPFELITDDDIDNIEKASSRGIDRWFSCQDNVSGNMYYVNIHTIDSPGEGSSEMGNYRYVWDKLLVYDVYDGNGNVISSDNSIQSAPLGITPTNCWSYKPSYIASGYDGYNQMHYVSKIQLTNEGAVVTYKIVNLVSGDVYTNSLGTVFWGVGNRDFTVTATTSEKPF